MGKMNKGMLWFNVKHNLKENKYKARDMKNKVVDNTRKVSTKVIESKTVKVIQSTHNKIIPIHTTPYSVVSSAHDRVKSLFR